MAKVNALESTAKTETLDAASGYDVDSAKSLLIEMAAALEACLECDGLDFTAEHDGEAALKKYKAFVK